MKIFDFYDFLDQVTNSFQNLNNEGEIAVLNDIVGEE
jgi:hypothetical protein